MARGLPDWATESRPHHGRVHSPVVTRNHPGIETWTLIDHVGKGVILGGYLAHTAAVGGHENCGLTIIIDNEVVVFDNIYTFFRDNWTNLNAGPIYLTKYDLINFQFQFVFSSVWTFLERVVVRVDEFTGPGATVMRLDYTSFV